MTRVWNQRRGATLAGSLIGAMLLGIGAAGIPASGAAESPGTPSGDATAAGLFATYSDEENFFPGAATVPPSTWAPLATGGLETTGTGHAQAAFVFNPYQDAPGAVNALRPAGTPEVPADDLRSLEYASVNGEAPQSHDASVVPPESGFPGGRVHAALEEEGPAAVSEVIATAVAPAPGLTIDSIISRTRVSRAGGHAASTAATILEGVTVADTLTFESIVVMAASTADGGAGDTSAAVRVNGAAVSGTAVTITDEGAVVADTEVPVASGEVAGALAEAGIELLAPGGESTQPAGDNSVAEARGPSFRFTSAQNQRLEFVFGLASTSSVLFDPSGPVSAPEAGSDQEEAHEDVPAPAAASRMPADTPDVSEVAEAGSPVRPSPVASGAAGAGLDPRAGHDGGGGRTGLLSGGSGPDPIVGPERSAVGRYGQGSASGATAADGGTGFATGNPSGRESPMIAAPAAASGTQSVTDRVNLVYGAFAVVGLAFLAVALGFPPGSRWAGDA